jgi:hypothetical protein
MPLGLLLNTGIVTATLTSGDECLIELFTGRST